jgi:hypothetical protein
MKYQQTKASEMTEGIPSTTQRVSRQKSGNSVLGFDTFESGSLTHNDLHSARRIDSNN